MVLDLPLSQRAVRGPICQFLFQNNHKSAQVRLEVIQTLLKLKHTVVCLSMLRVADVQCAFLPLRSDGNLSREDKEKEAETNPDFFFRFPR